MSKAGVNVAGYLRTESGVGTAVRRYVRALRALGAPYTLHDLSELQGNRAEDGSLRASRSGEKHTVNVVCADVELHYAVLEHLGEAFFAGRYNIGLWAWELPRFPSRWFDRFAYYDEIWVGTSFIANALAPIAPIPVVRMPPVLTVEAGGSRERGRAHLGASADEFVFLFVFDGHSHLPRKNPLATIEAFREAFSPAEPVRLVLKCVNVDTDEPGFAAVQERARGLRVDVRTGYWPAQEMRDLMAACDAYISLHRSEGTGLTISDAMALGKPVIATGWSGNMDFMSVQNSYPVRYELVPLLENVGPYRAGEIWAEPCVAHAAELMRHVFDRRHEAAARGAAGKRTIEEQFSERAIAALLSSRLEAIEIRRDIERFRGRVRQEYARYRTLGERVAMTVAAVTPVGATVAVVSKGDEALLTLPGRQGWHFPQGPDGGYAGYYPADSTAAIAQLEAVRSRGAQYLVFPSTARWWLDHYAELASYLGSRYACVHRDDCCSIYCLQPARRSDITTFRTSVAVVAEQEARLQTIVARSHRREAEQRERTAQALDKVCQALAGPAWMASYDCSPLKEWQPGEVHPCNVYVHNIGTQTWSADGAEAVRLGVHFGDEGDWPHHNWATDQRFWLPADISPGDFETLTVDVMAPATPGDYVLRFRLVRESAPHGWFDQLHRTAVAVRASPAMTSSPSSRSDARPGMRERLAIMIRARQLSRCTRLL